MPVLPAAAARGKPSACASLPIHNPSYERTPELWHAVAMQQERLAALRLPGAAPRRKLPPPPRAPPLSSPSALAAAAAAAATSDSDEEEAPPRYELTLAQRMGLSDAPPPELTPPEWEAIAARSREAEESRQPCVICCDDFRTQKQVLLSCGHVFHRECLTSWERHSRSRVCPVCRKQHYRKRSLHDGANLYRGECATRLQAHFRGYRARKMHGAAIRRLNPARQRRYCEDRLSSLTDRLVGRLDAQHDELDAFFAQLDSSVAASRLAIHAPPVAWPHVEASARRRGFSDCPVCLAAFGPHDRIALLSCSHAFHERCIDSFERFSLSPLCTCPVCRASYSRQTIALHEGAPPPPLAEECADCAEGSGKDAKGAKDAKPKGAKGAKEKPPTRAVAGGRGGRGGRGAPRGTAGAAAGRR
ncbi:hypothetical protein AB1Y20_006387 [Prymnesium parvum]|uniref:RING-type domain-containing protein n=1 Tax=Prymnesium parvum TaxID=97485 RepID=A0AB34J272_PRYPA